MTRFLRLMALEFRRATRDANTLLYIGFPVIAYPLLVWAMLQAVTYVTTYNSTLEVRVAVAHEGDRSLLEGDPLILVDGTLEDLDEGRVEAVVTREGHTVTVHHRSSSSRSQAAASTAESRLKKAARTRRDEAARELDVEVLTFEEEPTGDESGLLWWFLGLFLGVIAPATLVISATYPTMELFVIEREKQTLETLLTSAVGRWEIVLARLGVATGLATFAAVSNILALSLVVAHGAVVMLDSLPEQALTFSVGWLYLPLLLTSGGLVMVTLTAMVYSLARTFREAQTLFSVCSMALLAPSVLGVFACVEGNTAQYIAVPLLHTTTLFFDAIRNQLSVGGLVLGIGVDVFTTGALLVLWDRVWGIESLLTGLKRPAWVERMTGVKS